MRGKVGVVLYYDKHARYGLNAIIASIDTIDDVDVYLVEKREALPLFLKLVSEKYLVCVLGFSVLTTMLVENSYLEFIRENTRLAEKLKCIPVIGGPHASGDPIGSLYSLGFQYAFIGESEESFREFLVKLREKDDPLKVKGIVTKINNKLVFTGRRELVDLNKYHPFPFWRHLTNPIEITRGCPFGCKYCQVTYMHGPIMRHRSIEKIVEYAEIIIREGVKDIRFISPNSLAYGSKKLGKPAYEVLEEFFEQLHEKIVLKHGARIFFGTFPSEVRPEYVDDDIMRLLKKHVSNKMIIVGAQSGSNRVLEFIGRKHSVEDVLNAVDIIHKYGFTASVDFILGLPGEDEDDLMKSIRVIKKLVEKGAKIHLHTFMPLPGSPFAYAKPSKIPGWARKEIARIIGVGKAYGEWITQEKIALKIVELREKGIIMPWRAKTLSSADH